MSTGEWFLFDSAEFNTYWSGIGWLVEDDEGDFLPVAMSKPTDFWMRAQTDRFAPDLFHGFGAYYVLSEKARAVVANFRLPTDAVWKAVEIRYRKGKVTQHHCLILPTNLEVLNRELSDFKWLVPNKVVGTVNKWVLRRTALPNLDLFNCECENWICSRALRDAVVAAGLDSISLLPLDID